MKERLTKSIHILLVVLVLSACNEQDISPLPILGQVDIVDGDTVYHKIPPFEFINCDSTIVDNKFLSDYIYVSDFFFMSFPSICPKVKKQMLRLYDEYEKNDIVKFVSHTLDPKRDTPPRLKQYASNLGVDPTKWLFLHGEQDDIHEISDEYFVTAYADPDAPGGFDHSGKLLLVDKKGHIRAFAEGTDSEDVDDFFPDIDKLISEYESQ